MNRRISLGLLSCVAGGLLGFATAPDAGFTVSTLQRIAGGFAIGLIFWFLTE